MGTKWLVSVCSVGLALGCGGSIDRVPDGSSAEPSRPDGEPSSRDGEPSSTDGDSSSTDGDVAVERFQSSAWQFVVAHPRQSNGRASTGLSGEDLSLLIDAAGVSHIAYAAGYDVPGNEVRHAWLEGGVFQSDVVDEYAGRAQKSWVRGAPGLSVLLNNAGFRGRGYQASFDAASGWTWQPFERGDDDDEDSSVAGLSGVWHDGRPRIAYVSGEGNGVTSALRQGVSFDGNEPQPPERTMDRFAGHTALAIDASGTAHLLYTAPAGSVPKLSELAPYQVVRYVTVQGGVWSTPETLTEPGYYAGLSLVVDAGGRTHASFTHSRTITYQPYLGHSEIEYLSRGAGDASWQRGLVEVSDQASAARESLAVAADGTVLIAYCALDESRPQCNGLRLATLRDGAWSSAPIDEGCATLGALAALQLGADDRVHVAYQGCERELMYAVRSRE